MKKKLIVISLLLALTGCGKNTVPIEEYNEMIEDGEYYIEKCEGLEKEKQELTEELEELESEVADLEAELAELEAQIETELAIASNPELAIQPEEDITEDDTANADTGNAQIIEICTPYADYPGMRITMPEGFVETEHWGWYAENSWDASNIFISSSKNDPIGANFTEELYTASVKMAMTINGYDAESVEVVAFETGQMDGYKTMYGEMHCEILGMAIEQVEFIIDIGTYTYVITYTTMMDAGWHDAVVESVNSIELYYE